MRNRMVIVGALAALVAGCGSSADEAAPAPEANATVNYQAEVAAMPEGQRNAVFIRAIRDADLECQHVESSTSGGTYEGMPVWNVRCDGTGNWTIVIGDNGIAQVLNANEAQLIGTEASNQTNAQ